MDFEAAAKTLGLDREEYRGVVEIFVHHAGVQIGNLESWWAEADTARLAATAHTLKGSSATLGFQAMALSAAQVEQMAAAGDLTGLGQALAALRRHMETVSTWLKGP
jgi:HPt (histidine-containing phosphotransfer) domain-containing protein